MAVLTCASCGQDNPEGAKFCNACGSPFEASRRSGEERRLVSVLFVDLVGHTARSEQLDPEDVRSILLPYYEHVRSELEVFGGTVEKFVGDAVMGIFGAPTAYGDDAERAVRAALAVRDWAESTELQVRIAVNTGEAIVDLEASPMQGQAMIAGDVVNTASRLQSAAPVGAVLVGEETYAATRGVIEYRPAQPLTLKGKQEPVRAWVALHPTAAVGERHVTAVPLIGRERELGLLTGAWERVADEGRTQFITVFGPSGIGKTRLSLELSQLVAAQGGRVIRGRSTPYGASTPYSAFAQQIKQIARIFDSDDPEAARAKLTAAVADLAGPAAAEEHAPNLATLLGLEGDVPDRETLFFSARVLVESLALHGPTLLLYEDIHWADDSLLDLLETFAARVREVPVLFVALARPELLTSKPGWGGGVPTYTALLLDPLSPEASTELAGQLLAAAALAGNRAAAIAETAEGNPLFIEELSASLAERSTGDAGAPAEQRPGDRRGPARRAAARRAARPGRRLGRRPRLLARRAGRDGHLRRSRHGARLARGSRPDPPRGGVTHRRRPAVRVQARADPRRGVRHAPAGGPPGAPRGGRPLPGRVDGRRPDARGAGAPLARGRRERARARAVRSGGRPGRAAAGRRSARSSSTARRSSSWPTATTPRGSACGCGRSSRSRRWRTCTRSTCPAARRARSGSARPGPASAGSRRARRRPRSRRCSR